jgi:hydroxyacylglutathione hydrolase
MTRGKKALVAGLALILVLPVVAAGGMRSMRGSFKPPREVIPGFLEENGGGVSMFGARTGSHVVLFDAGIDPEGRGIEAMLGVLKAQRTDVSDIFLTHGHPDHTAAVNLFPGAKVHAGAADAEWLAGNVTFEKWVQRVMGWLMPGIPLARKLTDPLPGTGEVDVAIGDGKTVKCFPTPGHTPGHHVYLYEGVLVVGDTMLVSGDALAGPPSVFDSGSEENKASIRALGPMLAAETVDVLCTAHSGCSPKGGGKAMLDAYIAKLGAAAK